MRIATIIVNWNAGAYLERTLEAVAAQRRPSDRVLVVDNASTDGSRDLVLRHPGVELLALTENAGFAAANNIAASHAADCDWLAFLNPDAFPAPDWLERLVAASAAWPSHAMFASELRVEGDPERLDGAGDVYHVSGLTWRAGHGQARSAVSAVAHDVFSPCGAAAFIRRDAFDDVGGFDPSFFCYVEDVDLAFRLRLRGQRCLYVPGAVVHHVGSALTGRHSAFSIYHGHRNLVWAWVKNMPGWSWLWFLPQHVLLTVASLGRFALAGNLGPILRAKRDAIRGLGPVLTERRRVQSRRLVPPREVVAAMSQGWLRPYREHWQRPRATAVPPRADVP